MSRTKRQWADTRRQAICLLTGKSMQIRGIKELSISNKEGVSAAANQYNTIQYNVLYFERVDTWLTP